MCHTLDSLKVLHIVKVLTELLLLLSDGNNRNINTNMICRDINNEYGCQYHYVWPEGSSRARRQNDILRKIFTWKMMAALLNFHWLLICFEFLLGPRQEEDRVVTRWLETQKEYMPCVFRCKPVLECTILYGDFLLNLRAKATSFLAT